MAKRGQELYDVLRKLGKTSDAVFPAIVKVVNGDDTIDVEAEGLTYFDVRIKAAVADGQKGIRIQPAIDSVVIIERIGSEQSTEYQAVLYSELDEYSIEIDSVKLVINKNGFVLQKGEDNLKDVLSLVIEAVQQIVVMQGNNPDYIKLQQALTKSNNLLQ